MHAWFWLAVLFRDSKEKHLALTKDNIRLLISSPTRMKNLNFGSLRRKVNLSLSLKFNRDELNGNRRLPPGKAIKTLDERLYTNGIILFPPTSNPEARRKLYYHPAFIAFLEFLLIARSLVSLFIPESNREYFIRSADNGFFVGAHKHINLATTQYMLTGLSILTLNYLRYHRNQKPEFFDVYSMLAGKISPAEAGLYQSRHIDALLRRSRVLVTLTVYNTRLVGPLCFLMSFVPMAMKCSLQEVLLYGLPWSFLLGIAGYHTFNCYFWNMTYFYILCHFIKYRLREACGRVRSSEATFSVANRWSSQFKAISDEVSHYDRSNWSTVLFLIVLFLSTHNNICLYAALFVPMNLVTKSVLYYAAAITPCAIFFLLNTASVVHQQSHVSRRALSKLHVRLHRKIGYKASFRLALLIEALSSKVIGFYFLTLFIINYARFFEITSMIMAYFLKIVDLSRPKLVHY